jgi:hypothetical protein
VHGYLRGSGNAEIDKARNVGVIDIARSGKHQRGGCAGHSGAFQSAGAATIARPAAVERAILDEEVRAVLSATGVRDEMSTVYGSSGERVGQWIATLVGDVADLVRRFGMADRQDCPVSV